MKKNNIVKLVVVFICVLFFSKNAYALEQDMQRLSGQDRYETAVQISKTYWSSADSVILVYGEDFADALSAAPLSKLYNAPILLTGKSELNEFTKVEIERLKPKSIYIVGGTGVVSDNIEKQLRLNTYVAEDNTTKNVSVFRISGENRYATSVKVAEHIDKVSPSSKIAVVYGKDFPDAMSIAPFAAREVMPIILTDSSALSQQAVNYVKNKSIDLTYIVGGSGVISDNVKNSLPKVKRLWGTDRYETNIAVVKEFLANTSLANTYLATGKDFPDALSASAAAAKNNSSIILVGSGDETSTREFLNANKNSISNMLMIGGESIVPKSVILKLLVGSSKYKIVLDPGHGGKDSGAIGPSGVMEKNAALAVALKTEALLKGYGVDVILTRRDDTYVTLQGRCDISNNFKPDYFVSIHNNSFTSTAASGTETLYYPGDAAGEKLARYIQEEIVKAMGTTNRGLKNGDWLYVANHTDASAVLAELAFISNPDEEAMLASDSYQQRFAQAISTAIMRALTTN